MSTMHNTCDNSCRFYHFFLFSIWLFSLRYCFLPFSAENMHSQFRFQQFTSFFFPSHLLDCFRFFLVIHCCCEETYKKAFCLLFLSIFTNFTFHFHFFQHTKPKKVSFSYQLPGVELYIFRRHKDASV